MKKLLIEILRSVPSIVAVVGLLLVLGAVGASDVDAPVREWLPMFLVGFAMFLVGALPALIKK